MASGLMPPDPVGDLQHGPSDTWRPAAHHLRKMELWAAWLEKVGIPADKADAWAFELWKIGQKVETRQ